ncbi:alpha-soluble nsf attachment protein [Anaeramoeba flamelloides]|uniref:Alpha-soluble nsf attachment protein n=1 Tax=Anaeramoeba flamelloides TaxID=1746091 RepID=A0AAV7Y5V5_9EUKA|nr:alpha-soluble nsf attachment protein [Anaeramoeba flamelloides]
MNKKLESKQKRKLQRTERADLMIQKAKKKMSSRSLFFGYEKYQESFTLFKRAGNLYKMNTLWKKAAEAYISAANCQHKNKNDLEYACYLCTAARCYQNVSIKKSIKLFLKAIECLKYTGRFEIAAKYQKQVAEIYEKSGQIENAIFHYEKAAELHEIEDKTFASRKIKLKIAYMKALQGKYEESIEIYEDIAIESLSFRSGKWSAKEYFYRAGILHMCLGDPELTRKALERYDELDVNFSRQKEFKFLNDLADAFEEGNVNKLTLIIKDFDQIHRFDDWKITLLLKIKTLCKNKNTEELL